MLINFSVNYNQINKIYNFDLPEWLHKLDCYSMGQFILASIEQVIGVRYVIIKLF